MKKLIIFSSLLAASVLFAQEPDRGFYLGVGAGSADKGDFDSTELVEAYGGFRFNHYFALEAGYIEFGDFELNGSFGTTKTEASGWKLIALGKYPLSKRFSIYGGGGAFFSDVTESEFFEDIAFDEDESETGLALEGGIEFRITSKLALNLEYADYVLELYDYEVDNNGQGFALRADDSVTSFKLTLHYRF